jgi:hypothetical protein
MSKFKKKSTIIPIGDFEKVQAADEEKGFYENPMIPWWNKLTHSLRPGPHKQTRAATWCKLCGRKHSKREECEVLRLEEDLTCPPTKEDKNGNLIPNRTVGYYITMEKE